MSGVTKDKTYKILPSWLIYFFVEIGAEMGLNRGKIG